MTEAQRTPLAMNATMLDAVPPGHALSTMTPVANAGSNPANLRTTQHLAAHMTLHASVLSQICKNDLVAAVFTTTCVIVCEVQ
jgi:hypothetical protein